MNLNVANVALLLFLMILKTIRKCLFHMIKDFFDLT